MANLPDFDDRHLPKLRAQLSELNWAADYKNLVQEFKQKLNRDLDKASMMLNKLIAARTKALSLVDSCESRVATIQNRITIEKQFASTRAPECEPAQLRWQQLLNEWANVQKDAVSLEASLTSAITELTPLMERVTAEHWDLDHLKKQLCLYERILADNDEHLERRQRSDSESLKILERIELKVKIYRQVLQSRLNVQ